MNHEFSGEEALFFAERQEQKESKEIPVEIEQRLTEIVSEQEFRDKLLSAGAKETIKRRVLRDQRFEAPAQSIDTLNYQDLELHDIEYKDRPGFLTLLKTLGFKVVEPGLQSNYVITSGSRPEKIDDFVIRIRAEETEGKSPKYKLTLKGPKQEDGEYKVREELEVGILKPAKVLELLKQAGFNIKSIREKYRTTFVLEVETGKIVTIDLDQSVNENIPAWAEIETKDETAIELAKKKIGYSGSVSKSGENKHLKGVQEKIGKDKLPDINNIVRGK